MAGGAAAVSACKNGEGGALGSYILTYQRYPLVDSTVLAQSSVATLAWTLGSRERFTGNPIGTRIQSQT